MQYLSNLMTSPGTHTAISQ